MKVAWVASAGVAEDAQATNVARVRALGLRYAEPGARHEYPVAVIGAGPSVAKHIDELRNWPGERWAINGAALWCQDHGIDATFISIDAGAWGNEVMAPFNCPGNKALLASCVDMKLIHVLSACRIEVFDLQAQGGIAHGTTTATACLCLSIRLGHPGAVFFGCESSFSDGATHVNEAPRLGDAIMVRSGGDYLTSPKMVIQAEELAEAIRAFPNVYSERSGGLLAALIECGDYDVAAVSDAVRETINPKPSLAELPRLAVAA